MSEAERGLIEMLLLAIQVVGAVASGITLHLAFERWRQRRHEPKQGVYGRILMHPPRDWWLDG